MKILTKTLDTVLFIVFQICKAFVLWYMSRQEMPGIPDIETWLCE